MDKKILVVDDVPEMAQLLELNLSKHGYTVSSASTGQEATDAIEGGFEGVILLDLRLPDVDGLELLEWIRAYDPDLPVIIITAHGTIDLAISAIRMGAFDFITKTDNLVERLFVSSNNAFKHFELSSRVKSLTDELGSKYSFDAIVTQSKEMRHIFKLLRHVIDSKVTVLIQGESGTGKELVARAIHFNGPRKGGPFIPINCAGIPETLLESELFGYEKGAFTGAVARKIGKFEMADKGTIFLDEIGELPLNLQSKLLRVIQDREIERLGATQSRKIDVRIISATNRDLKQEVAQDRFREDLYYRLAVFPIYLPSLRERTGDIPLLVNYFIKKFAIEEDKDIKGISDEALQFLEGYTFNGNVRELENIISHAAVVCNTSEITLDDLPRHLVKEARPSFEPNGTGVDPVKGLEQAVTKLMKRPDQIPSLEVVEELLLRHALKITRNNVIKASSILGLSRATMYRRMKKFGIDRE